MGKAPPGCPGGSSGVGTHACTWMDRFSRHAAHPARGLPNLRPAAQTASPVSWVGGFTVQPGRPDQKVQVRGRPSARSVRSCSGWWRSCPRLRCQRCSMTCAVTFAQSRTSPGPQLGSAPVRAVPLTWRPGPRSCLTTGSAARRDHLRHPALWWPLHCLMMPTTWRAFACSPTCTPPTGDSWSRPPWSPRSGTSWLVKPGPVEALFLQSLADGDFSAIELTTSDFARMAELGSGVRRPSAWNHRRVRHRPR